MNKTLNLEVQRHKTIKSINKLKLQYFTDNNTSCKWELDENEKVYKKTNKKTPDVNRIPRR